MPEGGFQVVIFELGGLRSAVPAAAVVEILPAAALTTLPNAPPIIEGLLDVRGRVTAVLDIRRRLGLAARPMVPSDHLMVLWRRFVPVAIRVDRVLGLAELDPAQIDAADELTLHADTVDGVVRLADGLLLLHDPGRFLTQAEAAELDAMEPVA